MHTTTHPAPATTHPGTDTSPTPSDIRRLLAKRSFAVLATTSPADRPHAAGVLYELVGDDLWVNTLRSSRKVRNIDINPRVAVTVPVRRLPVGPPSSIHFQTTAEHVAVDDPAVQSLLDAGKLTSLTSHGELDLPDGCFVRIPLPSRVLTHGLGMSLRKLIADPLTAGRTVLMDSES